MQILDARNSEEERKMIQVSIKGQNRLKGSKYIKPTTNIFGSYNNPRKPDLVEWVEKDQLNENSAVGLGEL